MCTVQGCESKNIARNLCGKHYQKWRKFGDPTAGRSRAPNGTGRITPNGYFCRQVNGNQKMEHIQIAERAIGKPLPKGVHVHHVDGNRLNNSPTNLVICTPIYHKLIHRRTAALEACGNPNWIRCGKCKQFDSKDSLRRRSREHFVHLSCEREYWRLLKLKRK